MIKCKSCNRPFKFEYSTFQKKKIYVPNCSCKKDGSKNNIKPLDAAFKKIDEWLKNRGNK